MRRFFFRAVPLEAADTTPATPANEGPHDARLAALGAAIAALPTQLKEPLLLTVFEGMLQAEAASLLNISAKAGLSRQATKNLGAGAIEAGRRL